MVSQWTSPSNPWNHPEVLHIPPQGSTIFITFLLLNRKIATCKSAIHTIVEENHRLLSILFVKRSVSLPFPKWKTKKERILKNVTNHSSLELFVYILDGVVLWVCLRWWYIITVHSLTSISSILSWHYGVWCDIMVDIYNTERNYSSDIEMRWMSSLINTMTLCSVWCGRVSGVVGQPQKNMYVENVDQLPIDNTKY